VSHGDSPSYLQGIWLSMGGDWLAYLPRDRRQNGGHDHDLQGVQPGYPPYTPYTFAASLRAAYRFGLALLKSKAAGPFALAPNSLRH